MLPQTKQYLGRCFKLADESADNYIDDEIKHKFEVLQMKLQYLRKESSLSSNNNGAANGAANGTQVLDSNDVVNRKVGRLSFEELNDDNDSKGQQWSDDDQYLELLEKAKTLDLEKLIKNEFIV